MDPDATYKSILSHAIMVEELMHWLVAERHGMHALVDALNLSTLTRMHEQSVSTGATALRRHSNDMVWRVDVRARGEKDAPAPAGRSAPPTGGDGVEPETSGDDAEPEASGPWLYLVVMLEFQSTVDYLMPLRIRNYVDRFHMEQWRGRRFRSTDRLAPVLPIVLYIGASPWTAAARVIDLVTPQAAQAGAEEGSAAWATLAGGGESGARWRADPRFAGDGYVLLDSLRVRPEDLSRDNAAALLAGFENPSRETIAGLLAALNQRLRAPELRGLKKIMLAWAAWQARRRLGLELEVEDMAHADRLEDYDDVEAYFAARIQAWKEEHRTEGREEGREAGRAEGRVVGQRESMRRQAAMKFDAETAARLGTVLEGVTDQAVLDSVLAALIECDTPSELLTRATEARRRTNGRNLPADC